MTSSRVIVEKTKYITFRLIPTRETHNRSTATVVNAIYDLYESLLTRLRLRSLKIYYRPEHRAFFDIVYGVDKISFYLTIPLAFKDLLLQKISDTWTGLACEEGSIAGDFDIPETLISELKYRRSDIFSIRTDRDDNDPLNDQLGVVEYMKKGDLLRVSIEFIPNNRKDWQDTASDLYKEIKEGKLPGRKDQILDNRGVKILKKIDWGFKTISEEILSLVTENEVTISEPVDAQLQILMNTGKLSSSTTYKLSAPTFTTNIFVVSQSSDPQRRETNLRSVTNSYKSLNADNELVSKPVPKSQYPRILNYLNRKELSLIEHVRKDLTQLGPNIMSVKEVGKLIQVPSAGLQDKYPQLESIDTKEVKAPGIFLAESSGVPFGYYTYRMKERVAYLPINDYDELCLPRAVIAGMGQGKTRGYAANFCLEMFFKGFTVFGLDVAKGELLEECLWAIPPELLHRVIVLDYSNVDWPIPTNWSEAISYNSRMASERLTSELCTFILDKKDMDHYRTRKYLELAGKTVFSKGSSTILDVLLVLTSESYRARILKTIKDPGILRDWADFDDMTLGMRRQIYDPILYRLNTIMGQKVLKNIICQRDKLDINGDSLLDFRELMDGGENGGYLVILNARKTDLSKQGMSDFVSFLTAKIWLSALTRDPNSELRPCFFVMDEPHQYLRGSLEHYEQMVTESRKWRLGLVYLFHSWSQLRKESKEFVDILTSALPHYHIYSTSTNELRAMSDIIKPYTVEEAARIKRYWAINVLRAQGEYHTFITRMIEPPHKRLPRYNNKDLPSIHSREYGLSLIHI